jgi:hypothetical protein
MDSTNSNHLSSSTENAFQTILSKTEANKKGKNWIARCPAHDDRQASLSIGQGSDGTTLLKCFAGCSTDTVVAALGMEMANLFPPKAKKVKKEIVATYDYRDETGKLLYQAVRYEPKGFNQRRPDGNGGWIYNLKDTRRVLYRLPELMAANKQCTVFLCEGEKDVDGLIEIGLIATTNAMGAGKWRDEYADFLAGFEVVILPDNDDPGRAHAEFAAKSLQGKATVVKVIELPGLKPKGDVRDWLDAGGDAETLCVMAENAPAWTPKESKDAEEEKPGVARSKKVDVIDLVQEKATLFHDDDYNHYAAVKVNGHVETYPIESKAFRVWLAGTYFGSTGAPLFGDTLKEALATLQALAQYSGEERAVHLRLAEHEGKLYLDLVDRDWRVVEISADGWKTISAKESPVRFVRRMAMLPLPEPVHGGELAELRNFINCEDDDTWVLIVSWLVMTLHPSGPYPILSVTGEQGSAKSTACKILRSLVDPNRADLRAVPKEERDLMIAASNSWLLAYDNLSGITQELSDALCRIATGAGFSTRALHTDNEESIFAVKRPILTNGIIDSNSYPDLLDRTVAVFLRAISEEKRREEKELWKAFNDARPRILGALLSAVSHAVKHWDSVKLTRRPRMADFARWAVAAEQGAGLSEGAFFDAYDKNRTASNEAALDTSLAIELRAFLDTLLVPSWSGSASELFKALNSMIANRGEFVKDKYGWPKSANALSGKLRRIAPNLRKVGIDIECGRTNEGSKIHVHNRQKQS